MRDDVLRMIGGFVAQREAEALQMPAEARSQRPRRHGLPDMSREQRASTWESATKAMTARRLFKEEIASGNLKCAEAIAAARADRALSRIPVREFALAFPGIGEAKASAIMERVRLSDGKRVSGLGRIQAASLQAAIEESLHAS